jgi:DNA modification methylase
MELLPAFVGEPEVNRVYNCDALTLLRALPDASVDAVITDPPYGLAGRVFDVAEKGYSAVNEEWDAIAPIHWMAECTRVLKPGGSVICFGGRPSIYTFAGEGLRLGWRLVNDVTWFKNDAMPNMTGRMMTESTERFLWFCPAGAGWHYDLQYAKECGMGVNLRDVWNWGQTRGERLHPTQKPYEIMERIVRLFTAPGDLVVDCFAGSGTTLLAAANSGRRYIGGDITLKYVQVATERLAQPYTPSFLPALEAVS